MLGLICPWTLSVPKSKPFSESVTVSFEEQIMSEKKYRSLFSRQMEDIVIKLQIFQLGIFGHVTRLDQLRASEII